MSYFGSGIRIPDMQAEVWEWNQRQPWRNDPPAIVALGLGEEAGEVQRAVLKQHQRIRGTQEEWQAEAEKECGDVFIKLCALAETMGFDLERAITNRWAEVGQRDFIADPKGQGLPDA